MHWAGAAFVARLLSGRRCLPRPAALSHCSPSTSAGAGSKHLLSFYSSQRLSSDFPWPQDWRSAGVGQADSSIVPAHPGHRCRAHFHTSRCCGLLSQGLWGTSSDIQLAP